MYFAWSPKHSSFLCWLTGSRAPHAHKFRRPPTAHRPLRPRPPEATAARRVSGQNRLRLHAAALGGVQRLRRGCGAVAVQRRCGGRRWWRWPGASKAGSRHLRRLFRDWNLCISGNVWQSCEFSAPKNTGIDDHNVTCQYMWKTDDLTGRWNTNRKMGPFSRMLQSLRLPAGTGRRYAKIPYPTWAPI